MASERTLSLIKPDGVRRHLSGEIIRRFEQANLTICAAKRLHLSQAQAQGFYAVHKERPFYQSLTQYMASGPIMALVLEGEDAIAKNRKLMGATDPAKADQGTIRADLAENVEENTVHGSDAPDTAQWEIAYFFSQLELV